MKAPKIEKIIKEDLGEEEEEEEEVEEEEEEANGQIQEWEEQLRDMTVTIAKSEDGKLPDDYVVRLMKTFLVNDNCQKHGYVLDGYPKNIQQVFKNSIRIGASATILKVVSPAHSPYF